MAFGLYGLLTITVAALGITLVACAFLFIRRLEDRKPAALGETVGAHKAVLAKLRKRQPMSQDEIDYAREIVSDCSSPLAFSIPATLFSMGCFYVFGCLQQLHGATPSIRTFIGVLPMLGATNLTLQLLRVARLRGRLQEAVTEARDSTDVLTTS
jgi:Flp pilus assembly protein TadB